MSLSEVYADLESETPFPTCRTCHWFTGLEPDDKAFFNTKASDPHLNMRKLLRACRAANTPLEVSDSSFRNHIREHHTTLLEFLS